MFQTTTLQQKVRQFLYIVLPILITQLGLYAMNFFDTVMSGHAGPSQLAGVAIGSSLWVPIFTGLNGILMALTPIVSQLSGAGRKKDIPYSVIQALYLSIVIALFVLLLVNVILDPILNAMHLDSEVHHVARGYLHALSIGMLPLFFYGALRAFIDALGQTRVTMLITLLTLPVNIFLNYLFIYGNLGFPKLGGIGSGVATAITYWCCAIIAIGTVHKVTPFNKFRIFRQWYPPSFKAWLEQLKIGLPIGFSIFFEVSIFAAVTLLMSTFGTVTIAAHQSALNFASFLYMIPLSISFAMTIAVGYETGAKRYKDARQYSFLGICTALCIATLLAAFLFFFGERIAKLYSGDPAVIHLTESFLWYAMFFQLSDAVGAPIQGALRGYKDVNVTFYLSFISYWILGLPVGYLLARFTHFGPYGYWIGLISGLTAGAVILFIRLRYIQSRKYPKNTIPKSV